MIPADETIAKLGQVSPVGTAKGTIFEEIRYWADATSPILEGQRPSELAA